MKKIITYLVFMVCGSLSAMDTIYNATCASTPTTNGTTYFIPGSSRFSFNSVIGNKKTPVVNTTTFTSILFEMNVNPSTGGGNSGGWWQYDLMTNGATSGMTVIITNALTGIMTGNVTIGPDDKWELRQVSNSLPAPYSQFRVSVKTTSGSRVSQFFGANGTIAPSTTTTNFWLVNATDSAVTNIIGATSPIMTSGVISNFYYWFGTAVDAGDNGYWVSLLKNGTSIADYYMTNSVQLATNAVFSSSVAPGDSYVVRTIPIGTPTSRQTTWCVGWYPTVDNEFPVILLATASPASGSTFSYPAGQPNISWNSTEANRQSIIHACTWSNFYVNGPNWTGPGAGKTSTLVVRKNSLDTSLSNVLSDSITMTTNTTGWVTFNNGDSVGIKHTLGTGAAAFTNAEISFIQIPAVAEPATTRRIGNFFFTPL